VQLTGFSHWIRSSTLILISALVASFLMIEKTLAFEVQRAFVTPTVDGDPSDTAWINAPWRELNHQMIGDLPTRKDFSGRYKLLWTPEALYLLAEINDDILIDTHANPLVKYWDDDMLEVFIDEDASGGNHLDNFNAFAYHLALDNQIVDLAPGKSEAIPRLFPNHIEARWQRKLPKSNSLTPISIAPPLYWELRISVHNDKHIYGKDLASKVTLKAGKKLGFMLAYGDADGTDGRQHFIGDVEIEALNGDKNRGYIDASVFGEIILLE